MFVVIKAWQWSDQVLITLSGNHRLQFTADCPVWMIFLCSTLRQLPGHRNCSPSSGWANEGEWGLTYGRTDGRTDGGSDCTSPVRILGLGCQKVAGFRNLFEHNHICRFRPSCGSSAGKLMFVAEPWFTCLRILLQTVCLHIRMMSSFACSERNVMYKK